MKKYDKEELNALPVKDLLERLSELQKERMTLRGKTQTVGYPASPQTDPFGNIRRIKKDIARIHTFLHARKNAKN